MKLNAAVEQCQKVICLELLVLTAADRRGNQALTAPRSPQSGVEGGTARLCRATTGVPGKVNHVTRRWLQADGYVWSF